MEEQIRTLEKIIEQKNDEISELRAEISRRDNLLEEMGIHMPGVEMAKWTYSILMHRGYRQISIDGHVKCQACGSVFPRVVGIWMRHCPECARRMRYMR